MPQKVGDLESFTDPEPGFAYYSQEGSLDAVDASWIDGFTLEDTTALMIDPQEFGDWICELDPDLGIARCSSEAYAGVVSLTGLDDAAELAAFGDEFLSLWK